MKINVNILEIKNNKEWEDWSKLLTGNFNSEARESLKEEDILNESAFTFEIGGKKYFLGIEIFEEMVLKSNTEREVNIKHKKVFLDNKISKIKLDVLYEISVEKNKADLK